MDRDSQRTRPVVVLADERIGRRIVERLAASRGQAAKEHQANQASAHPGHQSRCAPDDQAPKHDPFAGEYVTGITGHGDQQGVNPHEDGSHQPSLHIAQPQIARKQRKNDAVDLPIRLIEEESEPQQQYQFPPISKPDLPWMRLRNHQVCIAAGMLQFCFQHALLVHVPPPTIGRRLSLERFGQSVSWFHRLPRFPRYLCGANPVSDLKAQDMYSAELKPAAYAIFGIGMSVVASNCLARSR